MSHVCVNVNRNPAATARFLIRTQHANVSVRHRDNAIFARNYVHRDVRGHVSLAISGRAIRRMRCVDLIFTELEARSQEFHSFTNCTLSHPLHRGISGRLLKVGCIAHTFSHSSITRLLFFTSRISRYLHIPIRPSLVGLHPRQRQPKPHGFGVGRVRINHDGATVPNLGKGA